MLDNLLGSIYAFITDTQKTISRRASGLILLLLTAALLDHHLEFSDSFVTARKVEEVAQIETLLARSPTDTLLRVELQSLKDQVLGRRTFWRAFSSLATSIKTRITDLTTTPTSQATSTVKTPPANPSNVSVSISLFWHILSAGWIFVLLMVLLVLVVFTVRPFNIQLLAAFILGELLLLVLALGFAYLLAGIHPFDEPVFNYLLNALLHPILLAAVLFGFGYLVGVFEVAAKRIMAKHNLPPFW